MDYYSILGINRGASQEEIKKSYRKLAMQHHPDRTGGDDTKFKQIQEAYATLSDPQKRAAYDNPQPQFKFNNTNYHNNPFADMFGFGNHPTRQRRNRDVTINLKLTLKDVLTGKQLTTRYQLQSGRIKEADVDIPPGVDNGVGIRFEGLGDDTVPNLPKGDLIIRVRVIDDIRWKRDGNDLYTSVVTSIFDLMLGTKVEILTLEEKSLELTIPKGTQPGTKFRVPSHGIPDLRRGTRGSIIVTVNGIVPKIENDMILTDIKRIKDALN
jgi:curved DNA-binding protein